MIVTFGEIMLRLAPPDFERILQTSRFVATFGGGEANVLAGLMMWPAPIGATVQRGNRRTIMVPWRSAGLPKHETGDR